MKKKSTFLLPVFISTVVALMASVFLPFSALAEPFYKGKTIEILGESRVGGGTDTMARITATVLPKHIPGKPKIVVRSMPGGAGAVANNIFYERGKPDGLHLLQNSSSPISMQLRGVEIVKYDLRKLQHIGHVIRGGNVIMVRKGMKQRIFDPKGEPVVIGTKEGEETWLAMTLWAKEFLNWNVRWVPGYSGSSDFELAFQRGEIDLFGTSNAFMIDRLLKQNVAELVVQNGSFVKGRFVRRPDFPDIPTFEEMLGDKKPSGVAWKGYLVWLGAKLVDKSLSAPPSTPDNYVSILRNAFEKMGNDPQFDELIRKMVTPVYQVGVGNETAEILADVLGASREAIDYAKKLQLKHGVVAR